jgi:hypothetical protein
MLRLVILRLVKLLLVLRLRLDPDTVSQTSSSLVDTLGWLLERKRRSGLRKLVGPSTRKK